MKTKQVSEITVRCQSVGIDIGKDSFTACIKKLMSSEEEFTGPVCEFSNNHTGFNQFVKWCRKDLDKTTQTKYVMEATGVYHEGLAYHLYNKIHANVYIVLPNKIKAHAKAEDIRTKTDEMDCKVIASYGLKYKLREWNPMPQIYRDLRSLCRLSVDLKKVRTEFLNHIEAANHSECSNKEIVKTYNSLLKAINEKIESNEKNISDKVNSDEELKARISKIEKIPGLGFSTIVTIIAETNGFELFTSRKQLAKFAGLDVVEKSSGTSVKCKTHISKKGNSHIRSALYFPAIVSATRCDGCMHDYYQRIVRKHPDVKMIGISAIQRKLLLLVYSMWKNGTDYSNTYEADKKKKG